MWKPVATRLPSASKVLEEIFARCVRTKAKRRRKTCSTDLERWGKQPEVKVKVQYQIRNQFTTAYIYIYKELYSKQRTHPSQQLGASSATGVKLPVGVRSELVQPDFPVPVGIWKKSVCQGDTPRIIAYLPKCWLFSECKCWAVTLWRFSSTHSTFA